MTSEHKPFPRVLSLAVHELRTPATVLAGYLRMVLKEQFGPINEKQRKALEEAERSCRRMTALIEEMSDLGKLEGSVLGLARDTFDFSALVAELASGMHEGGDRGVTLEVLGGDQPLEVWGDRARIRAAVGGLLLAGLRERGSPGVVIAACSRVSSSPPSAVLAVGDQETIRALIDAADSPPAFDEWRGGMGLVLPLARRVVESYGGRIWSHPNADRPLDKPGWSAGSALRLPLKG